MSDNAPTQSTSDNNEEQVQTLLDEAEALRLAEDQELMISKEEAEARQYLEDQNALIDKAEAELMAVPPADEPTEVADQLTPIFVYGTLKKGHHNAKVLLATSKFVGVDSTLTRYRMRCVGFPRVWKDKKDGHSIEGELYLVNDEILGRLDTLEGVPRHYERKSVQLEKYGQAWMYVMPAGRSETDGVPVSPEPDGKLRWNKPLYREPVRLKASEISAAFEILALFTLTLEGLLEGDMTRETAKQHIGDKIKPAKDFCENIGFL